MVDVAENTSLLMADNETKKFDELKKVILECVTVILQKLGYLKLEIQTIISAELMVEKKAVCTVIIDISKALGDFPCGHGYQPSKFPAECELQPKLIAFHSNMDLLVWENSSKISIIEDYVINSASLDKVLIVGVTVRTVQKILSRLPADIFSAHNDGGVADIPDIVLHEPRVGSFEDEPISQPLMHESALSPRGGSDPMAISPRGEGRERKGSLTASLRKKLSIHVHAELSLSPRGKSVALGANLSPNSKKSSSLPGYGSLNSRNSPTLALRSEIMTIRGTRSQWMADMAEMESTVAKKMHESPGTKQDQLVSELMSDQLDLDGLDMHKLHKKLTTLRKKGGRRDSDTSAVASRSRDDGKLSSSTGSFEPGGHLLSLFVPPSGPSMDSPLVETRPRKNTIASPYVTSQRNILDNDENPFIAKVSGYQLDIGHLFITHPPPPKQLTIIDTDLDIAHYTRDYFPNDHFNYLGVEKGTQQHAMVSVLVRKCSGSGSKQFFEVLVLIKTAERDEPVSFTLASKSDNINSKKALKMVKKRVPKLSSYSLEEITDQYLKTNLKDFELRQLRNQYRMGVLYCRNGQTQEDEMYSNVDPCPYFTEFLEVLGDTVELQGFTKFKGGLDVRGGTTGQHSVYTQFLTYEIMFHVSTLLPFQPSDLQRVERKRHLGNDVAVIVFVESNPGDEIVKFDPSIIKSQFNHVFIIVHVDHNYVPLPGEEPMTHYKISLTYKDGVPAFGPAYPRNYSFPKDKLRQFFLTKCVNAERAALHAPIFAQKIKRTRREALKMLYDTYLGGS